MIQFYEINICPYPFRMVCMNLLAVYNETENTIAQTTIVMHRRIVAQFLSWESLSSYC